MAQQWEYKTVSAPYRAPAVVKVANREGAEGWELVTVLPGPKSPSTDVDLVFKRLAGA